jgi:hypothetical protein
MSATENVRLRSREHRVPLLAVRLLLGLTECQDPQPVVPQLSSARPDKRKDLEGLFASRIFRKYCRQPFLYRIGEELLVTRAKSEASIATPKSWTLAAFTFAPLRPDHRFGQLLPLQNLVDEKQGFEHALRSERHFAEAHPDGIEDCIRDRAADRNNGGLARTEERFGIRSCRYYPIETRQRSPNRSAPGWSPTPKSMFYGSR